MQMTERDHLVAQWKEAVARSQFDIAQGYFEAALEAGAKELDRLHPGAGEPWRGIGEALSALTNSMRE